MRTRAKTNKTSAKWKQHVDTFPIHSTISLIPTHTCMQVDTCSFQSTTKGATQKGTHRELVDVSRIDSTHDGIYQIVYRVLPESPPEKGAHADIGLLQVRRVKSQQVCSWTELQHVTGIGMLPFLPPPHKSCCRNQAAAIVW